MHHDPATVLVLGGHGFIGSAVAGSLSRAGLRVVTASRTAASPPTGVGRGEGSMLVDLRDVRSTQDHIMRLRPSVIVNCAAAVDFRPSADVKDLWRLNALLPSVLAGMSIELDAHLIHLSGSLVHGSRPLLAAAGVEPAPDSAYGESKLLGDEMITASGAAATVLRLPGVFGRSGPEHLGLNRAIADAASGRPVVLTGAGAARRNYVSSLQVADIVQFSIDAGPLGVAYVGGQTLSIRASLETVASTYGVPLESADGDPGQDSLVEADPRLPELDGFEAALLRDRDSSLGPS